MRPLKLLVLATVLALSAPAVAFADAGPLEATIAPAAAESLDAAPTTASGLPSSGPSDQKGSPPESKEFDPLAEGQSIYSKIRSGEYLPALIPLLMFLVWLARKLGGEHLKSQKAGYILGVVASFGTYLTTWQTSGEPWSWTLIPFALFSAWAAGGAWDGFREKFGIGA